MSTLTVRRNNINLFPIEYTRTSTTPNEEDLFVPPAMQRSISHTPSYSPLSIRKHSRDNNKLNLPNHPSTSSIHSENTEKTQEPDSENDPDSDFSNLYRTHTAPAKMTGAFYCVTFHGLEPLFEEVSEEDLARTVSDAEKNNTLAKTISVESHYYIEEVSAFETRFVDTAMDPRFVTVSDSEWADSEEEEENNNLQQRDEQSGKRVKFDSKRNSTVLTLDEMVSFTKLNNSGRQAMRAAKAEAFVEYKLGGKNSPKNSKSTTSPLSKKSSPKSSPKNSNTAVYPNTSSKKKFFEDLDEEGDTDSTNAPSSSSTSNAGNARSGNEKRRNSRNSKKDNSAEANVLVFSPKMRTPENKRKNSMEGKKEPKEFATGEKQKKKKKNVNAPPKKRKTPLDLLVDDVTGNNGGDYKFARAIGRTAAVNAMITVGGPHLGWLTGAGITSKRFVEGAANEDKVEMSKAVTVFAGATTASTVGQMVAGGLALGVFGASLPVAGVVAFTTGCASGITAGALSEWGVEDVWESIEKKEKRERKVVLLKKKKQLEEEKSLQSQSQGSLVDSPNAVGKKADSPKRRSQKMKKVATEQNTYF